MLRLGRWRGVCHFSLLSRFHDLCCDKRSLSEELNSIPVHSIDGIGETSKEVQENTNRSSGIKSRWILLFKRLINSSSDSKGGCKEHLTAEGKMSFRRVKSSCSKATHCIHTINVHFIQIHCTMCTSGHTVGQSKEDLSVPCEQEISFHVGSKGGHYVELWSIKYESNTFQHNQYFIEEFS